MMKTRKLSKTAKKDYLTYAVVLVAFIVMQILSSTGGLSSTLKGQLVPICAYVIMALSLNLTVGVLGELSLGHAGFMSIGAFTGTVIASALNGSGIPDTTFAAKVHILRFFFTTRNSWIKLKIS